MLRDRIQGLAPKYPNWVSADAVDVITKYENRNVFVTKVGKIVLGMFCYKVGKLVLGMFCYKVAKLVLGMFYYKVGILG